MHIDFYCAKCGQLMRMGDESVGKQAKCPACGEINVVPSPMMQPSTSASQPNNPYQAPGNAVAPGSAAGAPLAGGIVPTIIDAGDIMSRAWTIYKDQIWNCILVLFAANVIGQLPGTLVAVIEVVIEQNANRQDLAVIQGIFVLLRLVFIPFSMWIGIGAGLFVLKVARGQRAEFSDIFSGGPYLLPVLGAGILFVLMLYAGLILCIVPGIFLGLMFCEFYYLILDGRADAIGSLKLSKRITEGNRLTLFLLMLIMIGLSLAGLLACFIGIFFVSPYLMLVWAVSYLAMTGQPTGDQLLSPGPTPVR